MKVSQAKKGIVCSMVMAVSAPDEKYSSDCIEKANMQIEAMANHYKNKLEIECRNKAEKFLKGKANDFHDYFDNFIEECETNTIPYLE